MNMNKEKFINKALRIIMSFVFLWAFVDKLFGLGFATKRGSAWINGISPTNGFLSFGTKGPFVDIFHSIAGLAIVDWVFMLSLLFIGLTLLFNKYLKIGVLVGIILLALMYLSLMLPINNPIVDEHIVYIFVLASIYVNSKKLKTNYS